MNSLEEFYNMWNKLHCKYINFGVDYRNTKMINWCVDTITAARKSYYIGTPDIPDDVYDKIEDSLKILDPNNLILQKVGM